MGVLPNSRNIGVDLNVTRNFMEHPLIRLCLYTFIIVIQCASVMDSENKKEKKEW